MYDLYGTRYSDFSDDPRDEALRSMLVDGDNKVLREFQFVSGISKNVIERLQTFNRVAGTTLYPPLPLGSAYYHAQAKPYILSVGRICSIKRVDLIIKALPMIHQFVTLKIVGTPDEPAIMEYLKNEIAKAIRLSTTASSRVYDPAGAGGTQQSITVTHTGATASQTYGTVAVTLIDESTLFD
jgi:glycosyltransferase involved in cell wall biosynthesis